MDRDDIIRMAQLCGFSREDHHAIYSMLVEFGNMVAAVSQAREREACVKAVETASYMFETRATVKSLSAAIRARGNT